MQRMRLITPNDAFPRYNSPPGYHAARTFRYLLDLTEADREAMIKPETMADDLFQKRKPYQDGTSTVTKPSTQQQPHRSSPAHRL